MSGGLAIEARGLGKRYTAAGTSFSAQYQTFGDALASWVRPGRASTPQTQPRTLWALKDVAFDVGPGEAVGIVGGNGAGKSTLLRLLSRITEPTEGAVTIRGRVGSLLEVGTGFHWELTGRENVYLNGAVLGMRRAEVARRFDEIVSFAGVEPFLDMPVKQYSSGMYMRLAFAVAAHLEPDILIVDEILAVGDAAFQRKCLGKMNDVTREGRTVLFVSHNLGAVRSLCARGIVLQAGRVGFDGTAEEAIAHYLATAATGAKADENGEAEGPRGAARFEPALAFDGLALHGVRLRDAGGDVRALFDATEAIHVEVDYELLRPARGVRVVLLLATPEGEIAFQSTDHDAHEPDPRTGRYRTSCIIPGGLLNRRTYVVEVGFDVPGERAVAPRKPYLSFFVSGGGNHGSTYPEPWPGVTCPKLSWSSERTGP
jgi:lipopolysaccharide transport system ATP-binding protein